MTAQCGSRSRSTARSGRGLPWWAVVLPSVACFTLLMLLVEPGQAHAAASDGTLTRILQELHLTLLP
jgi:hypothetical protein